MDNFNFDITWEGKERFIEILRLVLRSQGSGKISHYFVTESHGLILCWTGGQGLTPLPYVMDTDTVINFAWGWLNSEEARRMLGSEPDHDGDNGYGWRLFNESWGRVAGRWEAVIAIQPVWAIYGK